MIFDMRKTKIIIAALLSIVSFSAYAQKNDTSQSAGKLVSGQRVYSLVVNEGNDSTIAEFNRGLANLQSNSSNRGFIDNLVGLYKSSVTGQAASITSQLVDFGVNLLVNATRSKQPEWEKAIRNESTFIRKMPMQMEILDFYSKPSTNGPLDPANMNFNGFGCRQVVKYEDEKGEHEQEVFYLSCKVRSDSVGQARMLHHSKFQIEVDSIRFDYRICDLPNDSLGADLSNRIGFSFDTRENLQFKVKATITSSWINQALMVFNDVELGAFEITAEIDPALLDENNVFTYSGNYDKNSGKIVRVSGDSFLVPRSYIGTSNLKDVTDSWGTGQYKVEMQISETCRIKEGHYKKNGKWDASKWKPEWKKIKKRRKNPSVWYDLLGKITGQYGNGQWITLISDPVKTSFLQFENEGITRILNPGVPQSPPASSGIKTGK